MINRKASIKSGTEIPYQEGAASGATTTAFKEAVLKLDVTPNITPDDRILLDLIVNQDSVGALVPSGNGGFIPTIDTTELTTQVLVGNGETVVLGGVFKNEELVKVAKVPLLGDIPYLGNLFKSTANSTAENRDAHFHHAQNPCLKRLVELTGLLIAGDRASATVIWSGLWARAKSTVGRTWHRPSALPVYRL